jgi:DNA-binding IclR family transcriptional regulator
LESIPKIPGDEVQLLRILKRERRLTPSKASDLTGLDTERCRTALEGLHVKDYVAFEASEYWITAEGARYLAFTKSVRNQ